MELTLARFKSKAEAILSSHGVRSVGYGRYKDDFGDTVWYVHPHIMDLMRAHVDDIVEDFRKVLDVRSAYTADTNKFVIKER